MADALELRYDRIATHGGSLPGRLGAVNPSCRRPGPSGVLAAGTHNPICSPPEEGGEIDQDQGRNRVKTHEYQYLRRASQRNFKAATAAQGLEMTDVLLEFIQKYVAKNGLVTPRKSRRA